MPNGQFRVFLSAVTSEFGKARDALAADLRSRGIAVSVQSDFRQEAQADTTLRKLHDYIWGCDAVVCLVGQRPGDLPPPAAAGQFSDVLPAHFEQASYTQWEFFFARQHKKRLSIYIARDDYVPDREIPRATSRALQSAFEQHIISEQGLDRTYFSNEDQLCRAVLKEDWPSTNGGGDHTPDRLILIYNDFRDAYLSQKYYGYVLRLATQKSQEQRAAEYQHLYRQYAEFTSELRLIVDDVKAQRGLTDTSWNRFRRIRSRIAKLERQEPFPDRSLVIRFQKEVNHEIPPQSFWMPRTPQHVEATTTP
ncbi:MAG TPA: DUF4062 domain-containing protein [Stellaceae bacterium]|nr:DUF4062 domain-containing protein [Stellaceae bacterium]